MLAKSKQQDVSNSPDDCKNDSDSSNDSYFHNDKLNHESSHLSAAENDNGTDVIEGFPRCDPISTQNDQWTSPFTVKKSWNYRSVLSDGLQSTVKMQSKNRLKKSKTKKSRNNDSNLRNNSSSLTDNNILKTRIKLGSSGKKSKSKQNSKLKVSFGKNSVNGLSLKSPVPNRKYHEDDIVPNERVLSITEQKRPTVGDKHCKRSQGESEEPQYLELKPSVKFKCSRCGINDFCTMALLQAHMVHCNGHTTCSVLSNPITEVTTVNCESPSHSSVARNLKFKRKVLFCSSCCTYFEYCEQYIHMRETHHLEICLFCTKTFSKSQQLWDHLVTVHHLNARTYSTATQVKDAFKSFYITCCTCNSIFSEQDEFNEHECESEKPIVNDEPLCSNCRPNNELSTAIECEQLSFQNDVHKYPNDGDALSEGDSSSDLSNVLNDHRILSSVDEMETTEVGDTSEIDIDEKSLLQVEKLEIQKAESPSNLGDQTELNYENEKAENCLSDVDNDSENENNIPESKVRDSDSVPNVKDETPNVTMSDIYDSSCTVGNDLQIEDETKMQPISNDTLMLVVEKAEHQLPCVEMQNSNSAIIENHVQNRENAESNWLETDEETENAEVNLQSKSPISDNKSVVQPLTMALMLDESLSTLNVQTVIKECVRTSSSTCLYCHNATVISVNGSQLAVHVNSEHRYMPTKNEDNCENVIQKLEEGVDDLRNLFLNTSSTLPVFQFDGVFSCLQCSFGTSVFKDLVHHKRKMHHKVIFLCIMCKCNFLYYSQLLCHLCPGLYSSESQNTLMYHCCFCNVDCIPSAFRLMVHLRKIHQACDICLTRFNDQAELFAHMKKQHKMNHLCYKCNLAYRNRDGINEHLFWKHGTESVLCKRCLQKKWPHAYHFCIPATSYSCEECNRIFTKAVALTVHRRAHNGEFPFSCLDCDHRFISKRLLSVHRTDAHNIRPEPCEKEFELKDGEEKNPTKFLENDSDKKEKKKKRKREKTDIEKPLLDELKPLNLSSESDDDSAEEETTKAVSSAAADSAELVDSAEDTSCQNIPKENQSTVETIDSDNHFASTTIEKCKFEVDIEVKVDADENENTATNISTSRDDEIFVDEQKCDSHTADSQPESELELKTNEDIERQLEETLLERIKNCLVIEHSYCIPESIFRSEGLDLHQSGNDNSFESVDSRFQSPNTSKKLEKSKSVTPHKKKKPSKRDSSSSESSSDSDSSSSSCGSNCSCNQKSNSNCSSSSSGSEYSTTPDKRRGNKSADDSRIDSGITNDENESIKEDVSVLNARESDLDTDIITSDEDFYDEYPNIEPKPEVITAPVPVLAAVPPIESQASAHAVFEPRVMKKTIITRERKSKKRRRAPKITINLVSQSARASTKSDLSIVLHKVDQQHSSVNSSFSSFNVSDDTQTMSYMTQLGQNQYVSAGLTNNLINVAGYDSSGKDSSGRKSKRERIKNKFYGYSSSDEVSGNEMVRPVSIKRKSAQKRPSKPPKVPFVGIRAKKPLMMPIKKSSSAATPTVNSIAATHATLPAHLYRMPSYIMQQQQEKQLLQQQEQQQQQQKQQQQMMYHNSYYKSDSSCTSDDSDFDNLVINEPSLSEKLQNHQPKFKFPILPAAAPNSNHPSGYHHPVGSRMGPHVGSLEPGRNDQRLYCYCQCPYDEVSDMVACDGKNCKIEWFHFECVGIMVAPKGKWYCPQCRKNREALNH